MLKANLSSIWIDREEGEVEQSRNDPKLAYF